MIDVRTNVKDTPTELVEPLEIITTFFEAGYPKEHRKDLKKWRYYVINEEQYSSRFGASHLLANYEETTQLIKAAHALFTHNEILSVYSSAANSDLIEEKNSWDYYPSNLPKKSLTNPANVVCKFFNKIALDSYEELLHEWLRLALSKKAAHETLTPKNVIDVYDNLNKLYSAAWIIYKRHLP